MSNDRFKFRFWDNHDQKYYDESEFELAALQLDDGLGVFEQCTGQRDQFGKLVYEGDIVDQYSPMEDCRRRCKVVWYDGAGGGYVCNYLDRRGNPCASGNPYGTYFDGSMCVVVGNIHEQEKNND